ncbi:hypothetical protein LCGC14_0143680 [marine sediment metagenome]|uniref:DNA methylase N-4/N-6 domain-containing protein n=1 Tax=marine sediment metagenome TaxID=412755 RepID=A0A0F9V3W5_9ZZZZ
MSDKQPISVPASSMNLTEHSLEHLKALFPNVFAEGKVDFEALKAELGEHVETQGERFQFTWAGKEQAKRIATTPSLGTLRPAKEESVNWDETENLYIEGDNLEVLKLLQKSYFNKTKMIYIDPPYNTGKDFVYKDDFKDNLANYQRLTGQRDEEGNPLTTNTDSAGRYHSNWLSMMYPRLKLARNLLRDDGVIFISIDDNEVHNLRKLSDDIFGEGNFLAALVWDRNRKNDAKYFSVGHEYMLVYAKSISALKDNEVIFRGEKDGVDEVRSLFDELCSEYKGSWNEVREGLLEFYRKIPDDSDMAPLKRYTRVDEKGPYRDDGNINWPGGGGPMYEVLHPITNKPCKLPVSGWRYPSSYRFWEEVGNGRIVFGEDETTVPRVRTNLFDNFDQVLKSVHYSYAQTASNEFNKIFDGVRVFDNPKPVKDLYRLVSYITNGDGIILDFFSGSATTAHAVMQLNAEDGGQRQFIMVQIPEPTPEGSEARNAGYATITEIGKERIRRAAKIIQKEHPDVEADFGFKVLKLDSSNIKRWQPDYENLEQDLLGAVNNIVDGRSSEDLLYEVLIKYGLPLTLPVETLQVAGHTIYNVAGGSLVACFDEGIALDAVQAIIGLATADMPILRIVFRDTSFADDIVKTNAIQRFKQAGINDVLSI